MLMIHIISMIYSSDSVARLVNDSVIGDPLMTVPLHLSNTSVFENIELTENEVVNLCYEIHGRAGEYFNLVSDSCVSVNAHYRKAHQLLGYNIIDEIAVRAVGLINGSHTSGTGLMD